MLNVRLVELLSTRLNFDEISPFTIPEPSLVFAIENESKSKRVSWGRLK